MQLRSCRIVIAALLSLASATACASGGDTGRLGTNTTTGPTLDVQKGLTRPTTVEVTLPEQSNAVVLFVIPGRGATVIYPSDSAANNQLSAGRHTLITSFNDRAKLIDTAFLPRPVTAADSARRRNTAPGVRVNPTAIEREGYLLLITSKEPLRYSEIVRRVEGVTIPIDDQSALNSVAMLVLGSGDHGPWSGFYRLVLVR